jgi:hypothetical protein
MAFQFSGGPLASTIVLMALVTIPIKVGAVMADAKRTGLGWCALAAIIGIVSGAIASAIAGGSIGGPLAAALGFVLAIRFALGTSFFGAIGLTIIALGVSIFGFWALVKCGLIASAPGAAGT